jgi:hypothetical protein
MSIKLKWSNPNDGTTAQGIDIYRAATVFTEQTRPAEAYASVGVGATEFVDEGAAFGETWHYMLETWRNEPGEGRVSVFSSLITATAFPDTGPGPATPIYGDLWYGYFGTVNESLIASAAELSSALNISEGTAFGSAITWHKFAYKNKILFVPQQVVRTGVSLTTLVAANVVDDSVQGMATLKGYEYNVRLLNGSLGGVGIDTESAVADPVFSHGSEWNDLLYPIFATAIPSRLTDGWGNVSVSDLGANTPCWVAGVVDDGIQGIARGGNNTLATYQSYDMSTALGWRPALELVGSAE